MDTWVDKLKKEYNKGKRHLEAYRLTLDITNPDRKEEYELVSGMISDMRFSLEWMKSGRRPGSRRGTDITDAYRHSVFRDMDLIPSLDLDIEPTAITNEQKRKIVSMLLLLSDRERQCYLLHMAQGLSIAEVGKELKITKGTAQDYIERAKSKVQQAI